MYHALVVGVLVNQNSFHDFRDHWIMHHAVFAKDAVVEALIKVIPTFARLQNEFTLVCPPVLRSAYFSTFFPHAWKWRNFFDDIEGFLPNSFVVTLQLDELLRRENVLDNREAVRVKLVQILLDASICEVVSAEPSCRWYYTRRSHSLCCF